MALQNRWMMIRRLTVAVMAITVWGCDGYSTGNGIVTNSSSTTGTGTSTTGTNTTSNGGVTCGKNDFCVNVVPPSGTTMLLHQDGNFSQPCKAVAGQDVGCIMEGDELDLYSQGLTLNYNVPGGMCSYMQMLPYFYYQFQPGVGPSTVTITMNAGGAATVTTSGDGYPGNNTATTRKVDIKSYTSVTPVCSADYSDTGGPNCCIGNFNLITVPATGTATQVTKSWGGNTNNCLVGPGVDSQVKATGTSGNTTAGYPDYTLYSLFGNTLNQNYVIKAPEVKGYTSNAYLSNYWQSGVTGLYPLTSYGGATGSPNAMQGPTVPAGTTTTGCFGGICSGSPWYQFECFDAAEDTIARIRVMVRSWTSDVNFKTFIANQTNLPANGTFNLYGAELPPFGDQPIEDIITWVTPYSSTLGAGVTGTVGSPCSFTGTAGENCGFGSMYPGGSN